MTQIPTLEQPEFVDVARWEWEEMSQADLSSSQKLGLFDVWRGQPEINLFFCLATSKAAQKSRCGQTIPFFFLWEPCQQFSNWTTESKIKLDVMTDSRVLLGRRDRRVSGMYCMFNVAIKRQRLYPGYFLLDFCAVGRNKSAKNQTK